jgi:hypothetical protein
MSYVGFFARMRKLWPGWISAKKSSAWFALLVVCALLVLIGISIRGLSHDTDQSGLSTKTAVPNQVSYAAENAPASDVATVPTSSGSGGEGSVTPKAPSQTNPSVTSTTPTYNPNFTATITPHYDQHALLQHFTITFHTQGFYGNVDSINAAANPTGLVCANNFNPPTVYINYESTFDYTCSRSGFGCNGEYYCFDSPTDAPYTGTLTLTINSNGKSYTTSTTYHFPTYQEYSTY